MVSGLEGLNIIKITSIDYVLFKGVLPDIFYMLGQLDHSRMLSELLHIARHIASQSLGIAP